MNMLAPPVELRGTRLTLRDLARDDWPGIHAYSSLIEVCRFQPWGPNTPEETRAFVDAAVASADEKPRWRFALAVWVPGVAQVAGLCELNIRDDAFHTGEIGYALHPDHWGRGLASEAAGLLLRFGFEELGLHRIHATCDPRNLASARVLEKIGMRYEGRMREVMLIRDGWRDSSLYAILDREWRARQVDAAG
jgi:[ribosomal protein S5]-alanine N-acetyltransferase